MIPAILAQLGLPFLVKTVGSALSGIDHSIAKTASAALAHLGEAIEGKKITPEEIAEANRHLERMTEIDAEREKLTLSQINETFRAEVATDDAYVRRWRPTFGYAVALTWTATMGAVAHAVITRPDQAPAILNSLVNTSALWGIALAVLGVSVIKRSQDKAVGKG